jgi:hypothetical protein
MDLNSYVIGRRLSNRNPRVYTQDVRRLLLTVAAALAICSPAWAGGSGQRAPSPGAGGVVVELRFQAFTLAEAENDGNRLYTERMAIPEAVSLALWTRFSRVGREVRMQTEAGYTLREKRMTAQELSSGVIVQTWEMVAAGRTDSMDGKRPVRAEVAFSVKDCLAKGGKVLYQPARMAVTRAVLQENRGTGEARLLSIAKAGPGRFTAVVELK